MPVYNGLPYLREAIGSLLVQDFADFELFISDNASNDGSYATALEFAAEDRRVRVHRQPQNVGATRNMQFIVAQARAPYFLLATHDDVHRPTFVSRLIATLEQHPHAVVACAATEFIDEHSAFKQVPGMPPIIPALNTVGLDIVQRVRELVGIFAWHEIHGIFRHDVLRGIPITAGFGTDLIMLMDMFMIGECASIEEPLLRYRVLPRSPQSYRDVLDPSRAADDAQSYGLLLRALYQKVLDYRLDSQTEHHIRRAMIETVALENPGWRNAILQGFGLNPAAIGRDRCVAIITAVVDGTAAPL